MARVKGENMKDGETKKRRRKNRRIFLCLIRVLKRKIKKNWGWIEFFPFQVREKMTLRKKKKKIQSYPNSFFLVLIVSVQ